MFAARFASSVLGRQGAVASLRLAHVRHMSAQADSALHAEFAKTVKDNPLVVFMKGTPEQPMCGFSRAVVQILNLHGVSSYKYYNVLEDDAVRQGVKEFTKWPTIPQVFINGEFVGGCDILINMHQSGDLKDALAKAGIESKADDA